MLNKKGSAMIWAVCTLLILMLVVTATLTSSAAYHARSIRQADANQAYLTARSAVDAILGKVGSRVDVLAVDEDGNSTNEKPSNADIIAEISAKMPLIPHEKKSPTIINNFDFPDSMGKIVDARITRNSGDADNWNEDDTWTVSATAEYNGNQSTVSAILELNVSSNESAVEKVPQYESLKRIFDGIFINHLTVPAGTRLGNQDLGSPDKYSTFSVNDGSAVIKNINKSSEVTRFYVNDGTFKTNESMQETAIISLDKYPLAYVGVYSQASFGDSDGAFGNAFRPEYGIVTDKSLVDFYEGVDNSGGGHINPNQFFRILPAGKYSLDINDIRGNVSEVFIFLAEGATLTLLNSGSNVNDQPAVYVYGEGATKEDEGSPTKTTLTVPKDFKMRGSLIVDEMIVSGSSPAEVTIYYVAPSYIFDDTGDDKVITFTNAGEDRDVSQSGAYTFIWNFKQYK